METKITWRIDVGITFGVCEDKRIRIKTESIEKGQYDHCSRLEIFSAEGWKVFHSVTWKFNPTRKEDIVKELQAFAEFMIPGMKVPEGCACAPARK